MAGTFILKEMTFWKNRWLGTLKTRWEAKDFIRDTKEVIEDFNEYQKIVAKHDLKEIDDMNEELSKSGIGAIRNYYKLFLNDMLWLDAVLRQIPDTDAHIKALEALEKKYSQFTNIKKTIERAKQNLKNKRKDLYEYGNKRLQEIYRDELNLDATLSKKDMNTLMNDLKNLAKTQGTGWFNYMGVRWDIKKEIKDYTKLKKERKKALELLKELNEAVDGKIVYSEEKINKFVEDMNTITETIYSDVKDAFENGINALVRSTIAMVTLITYLHKVHFEEKKLAESHDIPIAMAESMNKKIEDMFKELDGDIHETTEAIHKLEADNKKFLG